ncbi:MAG: TIGR03936 family radical SAM-associated protein [Actinomycetota bacterium]|nr:TIGR03936 family radical SAM-associated protein [Actinomycetota bacterium]
MRIRLRFTKTGKVRFTSHRDVARMWERAVRRVGLPVAYSEGFSPRAKLHFGLALSTGHESDAEYLDIDLDQEEIDGSSSLDVDALPVLLTPALPVGIDATAAAVIPAGTPSLQQAVTSCSWRIQVVDAQPADIAAAIDQALAAPTLMLTRTRKGSEVTDDVRPYLLDLTEVGPTDSGTAFSAHLATQPRGLRISELLTVLGPALVEGRVVRKHQWTLRDGARREPLPLDATSPSHAAMCAS